ncbi:hypothetical protein F4778DRAFT_796294 [Xylariomycetidae sp. FL2044]|nr:hypothetical protein F4778DRAFT_796294 [Xylariomycetidae sp. FL2044]
MRILLHSSLMAASLLRLNSRSEAGTRKRGCLGAILRDAQRAIAPTGASITPSPPRIRTTPPPPTSSKFDVHGGWVPSATPVTNQPAQTDAPTGRNNFDENWTLPQTSHAAAAGFQVLIARLSVTPAASSIAGDGLSQSAGVAATTAAAPAPAAVTRHAELYPDAYSSEVTSNRYSSAIIGEIDRWI